MATKKTTTETKEKKEVKAKETKKKVSKLSSSAVTPEVVTKLREDLKKAKLEVLTGKSKDQTLVRKTKKNLARALTYLNQKKDEQDAETN